jgi:hypothetical protein
MAVSRSATLDFFEDPITDITGGDFQDPVGILTPGDVETQMSPYDQWLMGKQQDIFTRQETAAGRGSPYAAGTQGAIESMLAGTAFQGPEGLNEQQIGDYFQRVFQDPAVKQYEQTTRPAWLAQTSGLHSGFRQRQEQRGYEDLYGGLNQQRGNLQYQNLLRNQDLQQYAGTQNLAAQQFGLGQAAQYDPNLQLNEMYLALLGQQPDTIVSQDPSDIAGISSVGSLVSSFAS